MNRTALSVVALLFAACAAPAQDWAKARLEKSPRHGEWVKVRQGKREVQSFIVYPEVKEKAPAVVVIHEIFGLTDWVRGVAGAGFVSWDRSRHGAWLEADRPPLRTRAGHGAPRESPPRSS